MRSERLPSGQYFMIEARGCYQMKVLKAKHVFREQRAIRGLALIVIKRDTRLLVLIDHGVGGIPLVVRTARCVERIADGQRVARAPAMQPPSVEAGVVEALTAEGGAGGYGRGICSVTV